VLREANCIIGQPPSGLYLGPAIDSHCLWQGHVYCDDFPSLWLTTRKRRREIKGTQALLVNAEDGQALKLIQYREGSVVALREGLKEEKT
jgi:hypothetical protein